MKRVLVPTRSRLPVIDGGQTLSLSFAHLYKSTCSAASPHSNNFSHTPEDQEERLGPADHTETWPVELQLCSYWASSASALWQVRHTGCGTHGHRRQHDPNSAFLAAAEVMEDCCLETVDKPFPRRILASYIIQEEGKGCKISATV